MEERQRGGRAWAPRRGSAWTTTNRAGQSRQPCGPESAAVRARVGSHVAPAQAEGRMSESGAGIDGVERGRSKDLSSTARPPPHRTADRHAVCEEKLASACMRATPLPPGALLSREEWRALGVSAQRLAGPVLITVFRGFSTPTSAPASVNTMCRVLQRRVLPGAVISHTTAAAILGIAIPWWVDREMGVLSSASYQFDGKRVVPSTPPVPHGGHAPVSSEGTGRVAGRGARRRRRRRRRRRQRHHGGRMGHARRIRPPAR